MQAKADAKRKTHQVQRKVVATEAYRMAERLTAVQAERDQAGEEADEMTTAVDRQAMALEVAKWELVEINSELAAQYRSGSPGTR